MAHNSANRTARARNEVASLQMTHYSLLELHPSAGEQQIRHTYRHLSRLYHPDTTKLPQTVAKQKFQQINEAYAVLSNPERRRLYDLSIGYSRVAVARPQVNRRSRNQTGTTRTAASITEQYERTTSAYLDATDRPLSAGELFALCIMVVTLFGCLIIAIVVGLSQPQPVIQTEFAQEFGLVTPMPMESHKEELKETATLERANSITLR